jgi:hypothetical protein
MTFQSLPSSVGAIGALTGDKFNPTGWIEPVTEAAFDALAGFSELAYQVDGARLHFDRRSWDEAFDALTDAGVVILAPGIGAISADY